MIFEGCFAFKCLTGIVEQASELIWVDCDRELAAERLNIREHADRPEIPLAIIQLATQKWQEAEDRFIEEFNPVAKATTVVEV